MDNQKHKFDKILVEEVLINNDYGFFAEYEKIYFYKKGVKILSTLENISYSLQEIDYYLLENNRVAKFIRHESLDNSRRELVCEYTIKNSVKSLSKLVYNNMIKKEYLRIAI